MDVERYRQPAFATALAVLGDHHLAEDAVQEAMIEALRSWDSLRDPDKRPAWIRSIVRHRCYRLLRKRDMGALPLPELTLSEEPWHVAARSEESRRVLSQMRGLPRLQRDVLALHYLGGCSHRETAAFLGVPESTVNNRLHRARQLMKEAATVQKTSFAGTVISIEAPFVDVRFVEEGLPDVFDALASAGAAPSLRVVGQRGDGVARCLALTEELPSLGQHLVNATADGGTYMSAVADAACLQRMTAALPPRSDTLFETGIKPIDLFCPLPSEGTVATLGTSGTGKMVVTLELLQRMGERGPTLICLADRREPALIRDLRDEADEFDRRALWVVASVANDPEFASESAPFDAVVYTTPLLGIRGLWPAVDPLRSVSRVSVSDRHARLAAEARSLVRDARARTLDPVLLELLAVGARGAAAKRARSAVDPDDAVVQRARRLEAFLTHPFDIGKSITGKDGETVPLAAALDGVEAILSGACDERSVESLMYVGALPD